MTLFPEILIISNQFDFSTDLIAHKLSSIGLKYLRLNRDQLGEYAISFNPLIPLLEVKLNEWEYHISEKTLKSIYFRAPTFLREIVNEELSEEDQLYKTQWAAFIRALVVFENVKWINNPVDTYKAEIKALQLNYAKKVGFLIPDTIISNFTNKSPGKIFAVKSIDTAILNSKDKEAFVYTNILSGDELEDHVYSSPFFIQQALTPKLDLRVTVIDEEIVAIKIKGETAIVEDWRKYDKKINYEVFDLPESVKSSCFAFAKKLNLAFAAIDLILYRDEYYFIEVNPTGEWAWLQKNTGVEFDSLIVKALCYENNLG
jgi:hypothetical protein